jgi:hypothetical protein
VGVAAAAVVVVVVIVDLVPVDQMETSVVLAEVETIFHHLQSSAPGAILPM